MTDLPAAENCKLCDVKYNLGLKDFPQPHMWTTLPCGHRLHNHCLFHFLLTYDNIRRFDAVTQCPECHTHLFTQEQEQAFHRARYRERVISVQNKQDHARNLWATNEVYRADAQIAKELQKEMRKQQKLYKQDEDQLVAKFKDAVRPSLEILKTQQRLYLQELKALPSRKAFFRARTKYSNKLEMLYATYGLSWGHLPFFFGIPKCPRLKRPPYVRMNPFRRFVWPFVV